MDTDKHSYPLQTQVHIHHPSERQDNTYIGYDLSYVSLTQINQGLLEWDNFTDNKIK